MYNILEKFGMNADAFYIYNFTRHLLITLIQLCFVCALHTQHQKNLFSTHQFAFFLYVLKMKTAFLEHGFFFHSFYFADNPES